MERWFGRRWGNDRDALRAGRTAAVNNTMSTGLSNDVSRHRFIEVTSSANRKVTGKPACNLRTTIARLYIPNACRTYVVRKTFLVKKRTTMPSLRHEIELHLFVPTNQTRLYAISLASQES